MDIITPAAPEPEVTVDVTRDERSANSGVNVAINQLQVQSYFGIQEGTEEQKVLVDLMRILNGESKEIGDLLWEIKSLESRLGTPPLGMSRLRHLFNYVKVNTELKKLEKERDSYL